MVVIDIINGCVKNDRIYQKKLYDMFSKKIYAIILRYTKSFDEANDILQETFIKVFKEISKFSPENSLEGWIRRIAINTAITHYKKNLKYNNTEDITNISYDNNIICSYEDSEYTMGELSDILQSLPKKYKLVFNLYAIEGYKHSEIAEILGIEVSTSKSQYSRCKNLIRNKLITLSKEKSYEI